MGAKEWLIVLIVLGTAGGLGYGVYQFAFYTDVSIERMQDAGEDCCPYY
jgi:hypothetical protein